MHTLVSMETINIATMLGLLENFSESLNIMASVHENDDSRVLLNGSVPIYLLTARKLLFPTAEGKINM